MFFVDVYMSLVTCDVIFTKLAIEAGKFWRMDHYWETLGGVGHSAGLSISRVVVRVADHGDSHGQAILGHGNVGLNAELDAIVFSTQEIYDCNSRIYWWYQDTCYNGLCYWCGYFWKKQLPVCLWYILRAFYLCRFIECCNYYFCCNFYFMKL